eukprot:g11300.t1
MKEPVCVRESLYTKSIFMHRIRVTRKKTGILVLIVASLLNTVAGCVPHPGAPEEYGGIKWGKCADDYPNQYPYTSCKWEVVETRYLQWGDGTYYCDLPYERCAAVGSCDDNKEDCIQKCATRSRKIAGTTSREKCLAKDTTNNVGYTTEYSGGPLVPIFTGKSTCQNCMSRGMCFKPWGEGSFSEQKIQPCRACGEDCVDCMMSFRKEASEDSLSIYRTGYSSAPTPYETMCSKKCNFTQEENDKDETEDNEKCIKECLPCVKNEGGYACAKRCNPCGKECLDCIKRGDGVECSKICGEEDDKKCSDISACADCSKREECTWCSDSSGDFSSGAKCVPKEGCSGNVNAKCEGYDLALRDLKIGYPDESDCVELSVVLFLENPSSEDLKKAYPATIHFTSEASNELGKCKLSVSPQIKINIDVGEQTVSAKVPCTQAAAASVTLDVSEISEISLENNNVGFPSTPLEEQLACLRKYDFEPKLAPMGSFSKGMPLKGLDIKVAAKAPDDSAQSNARQLRVKFKTGQGQEKLATAESDGVTFVSKDLVLGGGGDYVEVEVVDEQNQKPFRVTQLETSGNSLANIIGIICRLPIVECQTSYLLGDGPLRGVKYEVPSKPSFELIKLKYDPNGGVLADFIPSVKGKFVFECKASIAKLNWNSKENAGFLTSGLSIKLEIAEAGFHVEGKMSFFDDGSWGMKISTKVNAPPISFSPLLPVTLYNKLCPAACRAALGGAARLISDTINKVIPEIKIRLGGSVIGSVEGIVKSDDFIRTKGEFDVLLFAQVDLLEFQFDKLAGIELKVEALAEVGTGYDWETWSFSGCLHIKGDLKVFLETPGGIDLKLTWESAPSVTLAGKCKNARRRLRNADDTTSLALDQYTTIDHLASFHNELPMWSSVTTGQSWVSAAVSILYRTNTSTQNVLEYSVASLQQVRAKGDLDRKPKRWKMSSARPLVSRSFRPSHSQSVRCLLDKDHFLSIWGYAEANETVPYNARVVTSIQISNGTDDTASQMINSVRRIPSSEMDPLGDAFAQLSPVCLSKSHQFVAGIVLLGYASAAKKALPTIVFSESYGTSDGYGDWLAFAPLPETIVGPHNNVKLKQIKAVWGGDGECICIFALSSSFKLFAICRTSIDSINWKSKLLGDVAQNSSFTTHSTGERTFSVVLEKEIQDIESPIRTSLAVWNVSLDSSGNVQYSLHVFKNISIHGANGTASFSHVDIAYFAPSDTLVVTWLSLPSTISFVIAVEGAWIDRVQSFMVSDEDHPLVGLDLHVRNAVNSSLRIELPGSRCDNTCLRPDENDDSNGMENISNLCLDGGVGSDGDSCPRGTDCDKCGPRPDLCEGMMIKELPDGSILAGWNMTQSLLNAAQNVFHGDKTVGSDERPNYYLCYFNVWAPLGTNLHVDLEAMNGTRNRSIFVAGRALLRGGNKDAHSWEPPKYLDSEQHDYEYEGTGYTFVKYTFADSIPTPRYMEPGDRKTSVAPCILLNSHKTVAQGLQLTFGISRWGYDGLVHNGRFPDRQTPLDTLDGHALQIRILAKRDAAIINIPFGLWLIETSPHSSGDGTFKTLADLHVVERTLQPTYKDVHAFDGRRLRYYLDRVNMVFPDSVFQVNNHTIRLCNNGPDMSGETKLLAVEAQSSRIVATVGVPQLSPDSCTNVLLSVTETWETLDAKYSDDTYTDDICYLHEIRIAKTGFAAVSLGIAMPWIIQLSSISLNIDIKRGWVQTSVFLQAFGFPVFNYGLDFQEETRTELAQSCKKHYKVPPYMISFKVKGWPSEVTTVHKLPYWPTESSIDVLTADLIPELVTNTVFASSDLLRTRARKMRYKLLALAPSGNLEIEVNAKLDPSFEFPQGLYIPVPIRAISLVLNIIPSVEIRSIRIIGYSPGLVKLEVDIFNTGKYPAIDVKIDINSVGWKGTSSSNEGQFTVNANAEYIEARTSTTKAVTFPLLQPISGLLQMCATLPAAKPLCVDDADYKDAKGHTCSEWKESCTDNCITNTWGELYTSSETRELRIACPRACKLCDETNRTTLPMYYRAKSSRCITFNSQSRNVLSPVYLESISKSNSTGVTTSGKNVTEVRIRFHAMNYFDSCITVPLDLFTPNENIILNMTSDRTNLTNLNISERTNWTLEFSPYEYKFLSTKYFCSDDVGWEGIDNTTTGIAGCAKAARALGLNFSRNGNVPSVEKRNYGPVGCFVDINGDSVNLVYNIGSYKYGNCNNKQKCICILNPSTHPPTSNPIYVSVLKAETVLRTRGFCDDKLGWSLIRDSLDSCRTALMALAPTFALGVINNSMHPQIKRRQDRPTGCGLQVNYYVDFSQRDSESNELIEKERNRAAVFNTFNQEHVKMPCKASFVIPEAKVTPFWKSMSNNCSIVIDIAESAKLMNSLEIPKGNSLLRMHLEWRSKQSNVLENKCDDRARNVTRSRLYACRRLASKKYNGTLRIDADAYDPAMPLLPVNSPSSSPERNDTDALNNSKDTGGRGSKEHKASTINIRIIDFVLGGIVVGLGVVTILIVLARRKRQSTRKSSAVALQLNPMSLRKKQQSTRKSSAVALQLNPMLLAMHTLQKKETLSAGNRNVTRNTWDMTVDELKARSNKTHKPTSFTGNGPSVEVLNPARASVIDSHV